MVQAIQNYYMLYLLLGLGVTALTIFTMRHVMKKKAGSNEKRESKDREEGKS
jgi:sortase A